MENEVEGSSTSYFSALIPSPASGEPFSSVFLTRVTENLTNAETLNLASFLLSNNLPGGAKGKEVYEWIKEYGGIQGIGMIARIKSYSAKSLLESLFRLAVEAGDTPMVIKLLQSGVSPHGHQYDYVYDDRSIYYFSPLELACIHGDFALAQVLLERESNVEEDDVDLKNSLVVLTIIGGNRGRRGMFAPFMREKYVVNDAEDWENGESSMANGDDAEQCERAEPSMAIDETAIINMAKLLISKGAKITTTHEEIGGLERDTEDYHQPPLSAAAKYLNVNLVAFLIDRGADVNFLTSRKTSVMQECLYSGEEMMLNASWNKMGDIKCETLDNRSGSDLWKTSRRTKINAISRHLLDNGADFHHSALYEFRETTYRSSLFRIRFSVLDLAVLANCEWLVQELLHKGAIVTKNCLTLAQRTSSLPMLRCLLQPVSAKLEFRG